MFDKKTISMFEPESFDEKMAFELGLADSNGFTDEYFKLQTYYANALMLYVDGKTGLSGLDAALSQSELHFIPSEEDERTIYQLNCAFGLRYFFLRSPICIERLDRETLEQLKKVMAGEVAPNDPAVQELVEQTCHMVTRAMSDKADQTVIIYERDGKQAPNGALVFGLATSPAYDKEGNFTDPDHEEEKDRFLEYLIPDLENDLSRKLGAEVSVFLYT